MTSADFLPWMRLGLAAGIGQGAPTGPVATVQPGIDVLAEGIARTTVPGPDVRLRGPGDVIALDPRQIRRRDPAAGATGAETNYFCAVEFFAPDLPWRYTPTPVDTDGHLAPWLVLAVVETGPGSGAQLRAGQGRLPVLSVDTPAQQLPDLADSWAWAHVQVTTQVDGDVAGAYARDPGAFSARLVCPRRLEPGARYTACLVPAFEPGRLAGLGLTAPASLDPAWNTRAVDLPVYDSWEFTAGDSFDFASLARLIRPTQLPAGVGLRGLDLTDPGPGLPAIRSAVTFVGALHAPSGRLTYWSNPADEKAFEDAVRTRITATPTAGDDGDGGYDPFTDDPVVAPPVYGAPQVGTRAVPDSATRPGWFEDLNLSPQQRAVAGIGTQVVRMDQESLVAAAWDQARVAVEVNRTLNRGRLAQESARRAQAKWDRLDDATAVCIGAPALNRIRVDASTAAALVAGGDAPTAYFGAAFRRLGRPGGPLSTRATVPAAQSPATAIVRAAVESATAGPGHQQQSPLSTGYRARSLPPGMDVGVRLPGKVSAPAAGGLRRAAPSGGATPSTPIEYSGGLLELHLPPYQFQLVRAADYGRIPITGPDEGRLGVDLAAAVAGAVRPADAVATAVRGAVTVPAGVWTPAGIPTRVQLRPRFTDPMYERVRALSVDYLVPGAGTVPDNSVGLLEVNPAYVEAVLVGLNHEMSRELRWREYPAALGQTWFQRFWDSTDPESVDIPPIKGWGLDTALGRTAGGGTRPGLVALIRAQLIRRFPDVRVYAVPARWQDAIRVPDENAQPLGPSFVGTLARGTNFYGFMELTEQEARGDDGGAGWFFVLEEEPHATRFGLDRGLPGDRGKNPTSWTDLSWFNLAEAHGEAPWFCTIDTVDRIETARLDGLRWGRDAAVMAAITLRRPIQVFLHASALLPDAGGTNG